MDSADRPDKANARTGPDDLVIEPARPQNSAREVESGQPELLGQAQDAARVHTALAVLEDSAAAMQRANAGIDRLFAMPDDCALAMAEFYTKSLENQADSHAQTNRRYLAFQLGNEEYALDIKRISEIIKFRELTGIPRTSEFILGIVSLRGVVVPVFDLRRRLHLGASAMMPTSRVIICRLDDATVGLLVDSINQVVSFADDEIEPPPAVLAGSEREMVSGIGRCQGRMIIILNLYNALKGQLH
ncbi:MAG: chemotaxis protein CheW [Desulfuromonadales bacterium]